jgi:phage terminase large subunit
MQWPPNYAKIYNQRSQNLIKILEDPNLQFGAFEYYRDKPIEFIETFCITIDPRNAGGKLPTVLPFMLFPRQKDFVYFILECLNDQENGLVEKSRDMGLTWLCCAISIWLWIYHPAIAIGWGSRKEILVDRKGDPGSIFEKMRAILNYLPVFIKPKGMKKHEHLTYMRIINPENGATITGEAGDNIGRGGRTRIYLKDESAWYENPESIEAALGENTNVQIDFSSVAGTNNIFYNKRIQGQVWDFDSIIDPGVLRVFIMDWRDHPNKTQEWYEKRRKSYERNGILHLFAQEVDRDYFSAIENTIIPGAWIQSAINSKERLNLKQEDLNGKIYGALDVADEGGDLNAFAIRKSIELLSIDGWPQGDTFQTASRALGMSRKDKVTEIMYDSIGVGAGVKAAYNNLDVSGIEVVPWNATEKCLYPRKRIIPEDPDSPRNEDFFINLRSQGWWELRRRFEKTYKMLNNIETFPADELISIPSSLPKLQQLMSELGQPTYSFDNRGRVRIDKKPKGTKSPNLADAVMMAFWPKQKKGFFV